MKLTWRIVIMLAASVAILVSVGLIFKQKVGDLRPVAPANQNPAPSTTNQPGVPKLIIGDPKAKLTIIEYGDFGCPICHRFFTQTEPQLKREYIDTGKVNIEFRVETHIGPGSVRAGEAAYCSADQGKFAAYHDKLFQNQPTSDFAAADLKQFATQIGLDRAAFDACLDGHKYRQAAEDSNQEAHTKISGTPTFFIGNQRINGAQPFLIFKTIIDAQL